VRGAFLPERRFAVSLGACTCCFAVDFDTCVCCFGVDCRFIRLVARLGAAGGLWVRPPAVSFLLFFVLGSGAVVAARFSGLGGTSTCWRRGGVRGTTPSVAPDPSLTTSIRSRIPWISGRVIRSPGLVSAGVPPIFNRENVPMAVLWLAVEGLVDSIPTLGGVSGAGTF